MLFFFFIFIFGNLLHILSFIINLTWNIFCRIKIRKLLISVRLTPDLLKNKKFKTLGY